MNIFMISEKVGKHAMERILASFPKPPEKMRTLVVIDGIDPKMKKRAQKAYIQDVMGNLGDLGLKLELKRFESFRNRGYEFRQTLKKYDLSIVLGPDLDRTNQFMTHKKFLPYYRDRVKLGKMIHIGIDSGAKMPTSGVNFNFFPDETRFRISNEGGLDLVPFTVFPKYKKDKEETRIANAIIEDYTHRKYIIPLKTNQVIHYFGNGFDLLEN